jgi:hypothetical protein
MRAGKGGGVDWRVRMHDSRLLIVDFRFSIFDCRLSIVDFAAQGIFGIVEKRNVVGR